MLLETSVQKSGDKNMQTVRDVTYQLFCELGLTTVFGNVGSTEETFLKNFPKDFLVRLVWKAQVGPKSRKKPLVKRLIQCPATRTAIFVIFPPRKGDRDNSVCLEVHRSPKQDFH
jgi:hypothetical protein